METTKTTKEALQLVSRLYGKEIEVTLKDYIAGQTRNVYTQDIDSEVLKDLENMDVVSFCITSLRSLDEMTEVESAIYYLISQRYFELRIDALQYESERTHYLESIGIDTMNLKDVTIFIKD